MVNNNGKDHVERDHKPYWLFLLLILVLVLTFDALSDWFMAQGLQWAEKLHEASWHPPDWLLGNATTLVYALLGVSLWLLVRTTQTFRGNEKEMTLWTVLLICSLLWAFFFFYWRLPLLALLGQLLFATVLGRTILAFNRKSPLAACALLPVLVWTVLTLSFNVMFLWLELKPAIK